jgi:hypothetical protein
MLKDLTIENQVSELCDSLMIRARQGELEVIQEVIVSLIEYAGYELARHSHTQIVTSVFLAASDIQKAYDLDRQLKLQEPKSQQPR